MVQPDNLTEQISILYTQEECRYPKWINLQGLVDCATAYLSGTGSSAGCHTISFLGRGGFNNVYRLEFNDGTELAASVFRREERDFNAQAKLSEIETMKFVRESGLYPDIPVPKVYAWDFTFKNLACAPYVLMDVVPGENLENLRDDKRKGLYGLDILPHAQQLAVVKALAKLQASLSKPVPFDKIGSITADADGKGQSVGPLMTYWEQGCLGGPFKSEQELWRSCLERGIVHPIQEWCALESDDLPDSAVLDCTPHTFAELYQQLSALIAHFRIPEAYSHLVLHHSDLALRNILFDKESLSSDEPKMMGVIDWGGAQILPLMLTAQYPGNLTTNCKDPWTRSSIGQWWFKVPFDWTSVGDPAQLPEAFYGPDDPVDFAARTSAMVCRFYLRAYFSACYAEQLHLLYGDANLAHAMLFFDAPYYLKFHETVCDGWESWLRHGSWIKETYWRLRILPDHASADRLLIGPNVYRSRVEPVVWDLGIFEEKPHSKNEDDSEDS